LANIYGLPSQTALHQLTRGVVEAKQMRGQAKRLLKVLTFGSAIGASPSTENL
jgi:hypothetical protein